MALGVASVCQDGPAASGQLLLVAESGLLWAMLVFLLACCACSVSVCVEFIGVLAGIARQAVQMLSGMCLNL